MATLSASRRNSNTSSNTNSPRPSLANINKLLSLDEEDGSKKIEEKTEEEPTETNEIKTETIQTDPSTLSPEIKPNEICRVLSDLTINKKLIQKEAEKLSEKRNEEDNKSSSILEKVNQSSVSDFTKQLYNKLLTNLEEDVDESSNRNRACSERSDSGISDCSIVATSLNANLLKDKNSSIDENEIKYFQQKTEDGKNIETRK